VSGDDVRGTSQESRFRLMFDGHFRSIHAYAIRRVGSGDDAGDVVAEVFATAWRRIDEVPEPPEDLLWLYGLPVGQWLSTGAVLGEEVVLSIG